MTQQEKDALLEEAKRRYPPGTEHGGYHSIAIYTVVGELKWIQNDIFSKDQSGCIYNGESKKWAKIISLPSNAIDHADIF